MSLRATNCQIAHRAEITDSQKKRGNTITHTATDTRKAEATHISKATRGSHTKAETSSTIITVTAAVMATKGDPRINGTRTISHISRGKLDTIIIPSGAGPPSRRKSGISTGKGQRESHGS